MKILFLIPYPIQEAPSQRFRFEQYFGILGENGFGFKIQSFLSLRGWKSFFKNGSTPSKIIALIFGFIKRIGILFALYQYDFVFIHREATPIGPPIFEWIIAKIFRKKIIYDFDDAIWVTDRMNENFLEKALRARGKVSSICKWSYKISCGNKYLCNYARRSSQNVVLNPTTIDLKHHKIHNPRSTMHSQQRSLNNGHLVIGWTGSRSTLKYLKIIELSLQQIERKYPTVEFHVIADIPPVLNLKNLKFKPWSVETEIFDLEQFDIGLMPLPDDEWSKGKCGFKALQYMSLEIATVASPIGVNADIIKHGHNGFLAARENDWEELISALIEDSSLRSRLGKEGKITVENFYSTSSNAHRFLTLFT